MKIEMMNSLLSEKMSKVCHEVFFAAFGETANNVSLGFIR